MTLRTALATCAILACVLIGAHGLRAQPTPVNSPVVPQSGPVNPPVPAPPLAAPPSGVPAPDESGAPLPAASPCPTLVPTGTGTPGPFATPVPCVPGTGPSATPAPPPIFVAPNNPAIVLGTTVTLRVDRAVGAISAVPIDPAIVDLRIDQGSHTIVVTGKALGVTTIHVSDERGVSAEVAIRVALLAGSVAPSTSVRLTGNPATAGFVRGEVAAAVIAAARPRPGANAVVPASAVNLKTDLGQDNITSVDVPVAIQGPQFINVSGTTHVTIENFALPRISPSQLLVSDYPETLRENGLLFAADLTRDTAQRFLYYHFNPRNEPNRRILLKVENPSPQVAVVQFISGSAGPEENEMEVGHLSTRRFLVRELQNEGTVVTIPPNSTINLVNHFLPAGSISSAILQLREMTGNTLHLSLLAQDANDAIDTPVSQSAALLRGDVKHARGIYPVPEFFFDYTYDTSQEPLEIQIGALKLPNIVEGEALAGDYGVMQSINVTIVNRFGHPVPIAIYENPRGGRATGTYLIDRVLVQSHAVKSVRTLHAAPIYRARKRFRPRADHHDAGGRLVVSAQSRRRSGRRQHGPRRPELADLLAKKARARRRPWSRAHRHPT